jgi:hypothetical protein
MIGATPLNADAETEECAAHLVQSYRKEAILLAARTLLQQEIPLPERTFGIPYLHNASGVIRTAHSFCGIPCMRRYSAVHPTFNSSEVTGLITDMGVRAGLSLDQQEAAPDEGLLRHQGGPLGFDEYSRISASHMMCVLDSPVYQRCPAVYQVAQRGKPREVVSRYRQFLHARQRLLQTHVPAQVQVQVQAQVQGSTQGQVQGSAQGQAQVQGPAPVQVQGQEQARVQEQEQEQSNEETAGL